MLHLPEEEINFRLMEGARNCPSQVKPEKAEGNVAAGCSLPSGCALTFHLQTPDLTPASGILVAASLFIGFGNYGWDREVATGGVDGNERQVGRAYVLAMIQNVILHPDFHADFHRSAVHAVHRRSQDDQVADVYRDPEIKVV